jgi:hypothetical protein
MVWLYLVNSAFDIEAGGRNGRVFSVWVFGIDCSCELKSEEMFRYLDVSPIAGSNLRFRERAVIPSLDHECDGGINTDQGERDQNKESGDFYPGG